MTIDIITSVFAALNELNIPYEIDTTSHKHEQVKTLPDKIVVVTSPAAIASYDDHHPERIACMLYKYTGDRSIQFIVIVKNRESDIKRRISFWWNNQIDLPNGECTICFRPNTKIPVVSMCWHCHKTVCVQCYNRMNADNNNMSQCPTCRTWTLDGDQFGQPSAVLQVQKPSAGTPVDQLMNIIKQLDGMTVIIPRIGNMFALDDIMEICRLSFTKRYSNEVMRIRDVRKHLQKVYEEYGNKALRLYVARRTYQIDKTSGKPVVELSVFDMTDDTLLFAYSNNAYINVLDDIIESVWPNSQIVKSELVLPDVATMPTYVLELFRSINLEFPHTKTVSVCTPSGDGMNFDVDAVGVITTMHMDMASAAMRLLLASNAYIVVTCRVHKYANQEQSDFLAFHLRGDTYTRMSINECKKCFRSNVDGLKSSKRIVNFM